MEPQDFAAINTGKCQRIQESHYTFYAFHPAPLPPTPLDLDWDLAKLLSESDRALAKLDGNGQVLPNPHLLIRPYLRQEAILSSRIEDTHADMEQLALFEEQGDTRETDTEEVGNYVKALEKGLERVQKIPISSRLIKELHAILMDKVRGGESTKQPGEFRTKQNWIGPPGCRPDKARFVPPPHQELNRLLSEWESYVHTDTRQPPLVKAALMHYQFETIHPFIDGNGRIGRLLITLFLCETGCLSQPLLYLSGFFDETREDYYRLLLEVSQKGSWREWVEYFLRGVCQQAQRSLEDTQHILDLYESYQLKLKEGKRTPQEAFRILDQVFSNPFISIARYTQRFGVSYHNAQKGVQFWIDQGLLRERTGQQRNRIFVADTILNIFSR